MAFTSSEIEKAYYFYSFAFTLYNMPQYLGKVTDADRRAALLGYLESNYYLGTSDLDDYDDEVRKGVKAEPNARFMSDGIKPYLRDNLRKIEPLLFKVDSGTRMKAMAELAPLIDSLTFEISGSDTINAGGTVKVNFGDLMGKTLDALKFDLVHEFGHSVAAELKHPRHRGKFSGVVAAISPDHDPYDMSTGNSARKMEHFADAFATLFLRSSGENGVKISGYAKSSFGDAPQSETHPAGVDRVAYVTRVVTRLGPLPAQPRNI